MTLVNIRDKEGPVLLEEIPRNWNLNQSEIAIIVYRPGKRGKSYLIF